jgi:lysozyme family protein
MPDPTDAQRFARCLDIVLAAEGGYVDNPLDAGGATNMGITRATLARWRGIAPASALPKAAVKALTRAEAAAIYEAGYWRRIAGPQLPAGLDLALFDYAVNSGPARAVKTLQALLGVTADGLVGPVTLGALRQRQPAALVTALCDARLGFLGRLASFATFGRGWTARVATIRAAALAMAGAPSLPQPQRTTDMTLFSGYRTYIVAAIMLLTGLAGLLGVDVPVLAGHAPAALVMEALAFIFLRKELKSDGGKE